MPDQDHTARGEPPRKVGRYLVFDAFATGGMASVHFGRLVGDAGFARTVAVKRLHAHLARERDFRTMFVDEARLASRIQHPNVVQTLDVEVSDDELYLIMEHVHGESLATLQTSLDGKRVPVAAPLAAGIAVAVLNGLHAAHEAHHDDGRPLCLVHRDVSPGNILVGVDGLPRLLDFGVARASVRLSLTRDGMLKGKLTYLAPELLRGGEATRHVDTYAMGVVLWEMLTGRRLFAADDDAGVVEQILTGYVRPPSRFSPGLPDALDDIVLRALRTAPSERFESARLMARAIEEAMAVAGPSELGAWVVERSGKALALREAELLRVERYVEPSPAGDRSVVSASTSENVSLVADIAGKHVHTTRRRRVWAAAGAMLALLGLGFARARTHPAAAEDLAPPVSPREPVAAEEPVPGDIARGSLPQEPATTAPPRRSTPSAAAHRIHRVPPESHTVRQGCATPFVRDEQGTVHWKAECL
jgi:serine/threonine protein kinase